MKFCRENGNKCRDTRSSGRGKASVVFQSISNNSDNKNCEKTSLLCADGWHVRYKSQNFTASPSGVEFTYNYRSRLQVGQLLMRTRWKKKKKLGGKKKVKLKRYECKEKAEFLHAWFRSVSTNFRFNSSSVCILVRVILRHNENTGHGSKSESEWPKTELVSEINQTCRIYLLVWFHPWLEVYWSSIIALCFLIYFPTYFFKLLTNY